jgi:hypothetical protein
MPPSNAKTILLIELLDTGQHYDAAEVLKRFEAIIGEHGGSHINAVGKKIVCTLSDPNIAAETAFELIACDFPGKNPARPIVRMCICQLAAGMEAKEAHTQAVSAAVRELVKANAGQIVTTQETAGNLSSEYEIKFGTPSGKTGARVFEITPPVKSKSEEATQLASLADRTGKKMRLRWRQNQANKEMVLYGEHPIITFGREDGNDIVSESGMASRRHGRLEYRRSGIFIIDESTNGTYIFPETGPKFKLQRGEHHLPARGYFCLGEEVSADNPVAIHFVTVFSAS